MPKPKFNKGGEDEYMQRSIYHLKQVIASVNKRLETVTKELQDSTWCTHPEKQEGTWEWDSGYGVQKKLKLWRCYFCKHEEKTYEQA